MRLPVCLSLLLAAAMPATPWANAAGPAQSAAPLSMAAKLPLPAADPAMLCEAAVNRAGLDNRLPPRLLDAISLTETGRTDLNSGRLRPWPWTINAEGVGHFFATRTQAVAAVRDLWARGVRSIDTGCLQVNLMYHPNAFASLEDAFDPRANAGYAARLLNSLHAEGRAWAHAIAAYHSETPELGEAYRVLVMARWQDSYAPASAPSGVSYWASTRASYREVGGGTAVYGAFAPASRVYGAFPAVSGGR